MPGLRHGRNCGGQSSDTCRRQIRIGAEPLVENRAVAGSLATILHISGYVDIHSHVLPAVDDGPKDLEQSLAMARAAVDAGISIIAATPHLRPDFPGVYVHEIASRCANLNDTLAHKQIALKVVPAAEVSLTWALEASEKQLRLASYGQRGTDLLIETPFTQVVGLDRFLYELRAKGYRITLGHPERNSEFQRDAGPLRTLVEQGVLLQLNADSLLGSPRRGTQRVARSLLSDGMVHAIASDGHRGASWRPVTHLREAVEAAAQMLGPARAQWLASDSPAAIIAGTELPPAPPVAAQPAQRRRLFGTGSPFRR